MRSCYCDQWTGHGVVLRGVEAAVVVLEELLRLVEIGRRGGLGRVEELLLLQLSQDVGLIIRRQRSVVVVVLVVVLVVMVMVG